MKCKFCSRSHNRGTCPTYGKICNNYGNKGYFAKCCAKKKGIHSLNQECSDNTAQDHSPNDCENFFIWTINAHNSNPSDSGGINRENTNNRNFSAERLSDSSRTEFLMTIQRSLTKETFQFKAKVIGII